MRTSGSNPKDERWMKGIESSEQKSCQQKTDRTRDMDLDPEFPKIRSPSSGPAVSKFINMRSHFEQMLHNSVMLTEMAMDLKERCSAGEKYFCYLRSLTIRGSRTISSLNSLTKSFLLLNQKLANTTMTAIENMTMADQSYCNIKLEYEKLLGLIERELAVVEDIEVPEHNLGTTSTIAEKIKYLEAKQKNMENVFLPPTNSARSFKSDVDEKYPENWSRESLIDLNQVANLPPVPEDIFTSFSTKPTRTSSLSSLKSMRKVKLFLQRAGGSASDDEEDSSGPDDHDFGKLVVGDTDEVRSSGGSQFSSPKKPYLGNIKEESQD